MMNEIRFTKSKLPYGWMGNMSRFPITYLGKIYGSTEHLFQAMRFGLDSDIAEMIRQEPNSFKSKLIAKANRDKVIIEPCGDIDLANMRTCLLLKLDQHPELKDELMGTVGHHIYEDVTARGRGNSNLFWGALMNKEGNWEGKNVMGELWMDIRDNDPQFEIIQEPKTELEIERRFLLKSLPTIDYDIKYDIEQHYLSPIGAFETERVRGLCMIVNDKPVKDLWIHTIKEPTDGLGMIETEKNISWDEFKTAKSKADRSIYKARHIFKHTSDENLKWEIDVFWNMNLVIAEIEIPNDDYDLIIPESLKKYILMEITGMKQFSNSNLAEQKTK
jgi:predicted NAD-dependent protein-ADP-ribosyltransferase YbiA (DUF1768 family)/CYTH domain-containing protein